MAPQEKRDAVQAFGDDSPNGTSNTAAKRSKRRRSAQNGQSSQLKPATSGDSTAKHVTQTPKSSGMKDAPQSRKSQSTESPSNSRKSGQIELAMEKSRQNDSQVAADSANELQETTRTPTTKRKRTKRGKETRFGNHRSQIESILTGVTDVESVQDVPLEIERRQEEISLERRQSAPSQRKRRSSSSHSRRSRRQPLQKWLIGKPSGGAFINHDPILTPDQQFLILATKNNALVYSTKTSLLVRTIGVTTDNSITSLALVVDQESQIVFGTSNGRLCKFNWSTGRKLWENRVSGAITAITSTSSSAQQEGYLMIHQDKDRTYHASSLAFDDNGKLLGQRSLTHSDRIIKPQISFSAELGVVVICSKEDIMIGRLKDESDNGTALIDWQTVSVTAGKIACFDAKISTRQDDKKAKHRPVVSVAVGLQSGEIHLYSDMLRESNAVPGANMLVRRMHWHRSAPKSVKWSPDSNYLISGGDETVLLMWQLDTNQKQTLPHLTAGILNISVSANGSAYAVRLTDNSVMVISTADLKPSTNVSNLAVDASFKGAYQSGTMVPATIHPKHPERLLLAYSLQSLSQALKPTEKSLNMLQTFDLSAQLQLNRQALARNLVSTVNIGPEGQPLHEPDVTHLDISHDGQWLVTVDQWSPNAQDLNSQYLSTRDDNAREQLNECFLRFWSTGNTEGENGTDHWELNTRIDDPVTTYSVSQKKAILAVIVNPTRLQVAVADTTCNLRFYSPKQRMRSGVPITDAAGKQLYTWTCDHETACKEASNDSAADFATLAYSEDGSVLAASWSTSELLKARVHLIDTKTAVKAASLSDILTSGHIQLAWYGRYLLGLSGNFCIYDTITMAQTFSIKIEKKFERSKARMAVDTGSGVVAIAVCKREIDAYTKLVLLDIEAGYDRDPIFEGALRSQIRVLLPERQISAFLVVDAEGRMFKVQREGSGAQRTVVAADMPEKKVVRNTLNNVFGSVKKKSEQPKAMADADTSAHRSLDDVFKFETSEAPTTRDLFHQVARAIAGPA